MKILGWSNEAGGIHHYRVREPLRGLGLRGHETRITKALLGSDAIDNDILLVRGLHTSRNSILWRGLAAMPDRRVRLVFDFDDDAWAWQPGSPEDDYWTFERRYSLETNIQCADLVTTPSPRLAKVLQGLNPNIVVLPNTVPQILLSLRPEKRERFVIGWQGARQHTRDLQLVYNPVLRFLLHHKDTEFHLWGPMGTEHFPDALADRIICHPWIESTWQHYYRLSMDIGLAPLDPADPFNDTKSDIRLREYAALGIPYIASNVNAYFDTARKSGGFLASDESEWEECLEYLYQHRSVRETHSQMGRAMAVNWTTEGNAHLWEDAYVSASNRNSGSPGSSSPAYSSSPSSEA